MSTQESSAQTRRSIAPVVRKIKLTEQTSDFAYWQTQPHEARLAALYEIRQEYYGWTDETEPRLQRVCRVESLNANEVRYLVVGGYAVALHGYPRLTKDLDVWLWLDTENASRIVQALADFGFGSLGLEAADFLVPDQIIQLGYPPNRIDLITTLPGVDFESCYETRVVIMVDQIPVDFIDLESLKRNKQASGRLQDLADLENLA